MRLGTTVLAVALALSMPVLADDPPHGGVGGAPMVGGGHFQGAGGTWVAHPGWQGSYPAYRAVARRPLVARHLWRAVRFVVDRRTGLVPVPGGDCANSRLLHAA